MKKIIVWFVVVLLITSCENPSDCIESSGDLVIKEISVAPFSKLKVYRGIEVIITEGADYKVEIQAGQNFINDVEVTQNGDQLFFKEKARCNWVRDYGQTKILVTTPTLTEIYSKTDRQISSNGILNFPVLSILSFDEDADGESGAGTGDFHLRVDNNQLIIQNNNVSRFYIAGTTTDAIFNIYFGDGRIEAQNLIAKNIAIFHRGSNDMIVRPTEKITGKLFSTGNVILKNVPPIQELEELYQGRVIYP